MTFKFEIKGFDKIKKSNDQMIRAVAPEGFAELTVKIKKIAKEIWLLKLLEVSFVFHAVLQIRDHWI